MSPRFAAEKTLGKLAKWLRLLGFDTLYEPDFGYRSVSDLADHGRIVLTRTQRIRDKTSAANLIFIQSDRPLEQLKEIIQKLSLKQTDTHPFTRCLKCNTVIEPVDKDTIRSEVPDYVWETQHSFRMCPGCRKIFWRGSHTKRSSYIIEGLFSN
ncbi:MAG: Mut7-C RNAse domain-containing protein [Desulfobacterales bacterium]|jgi:uncharacterized protein with PIN domain